MKMTRRDLLRIGGTSLLFAGLSPLSTLASGGAPGSRRRLFFNESDLPRIRANARSPLLQPMFAEWATHTPADLATAIDAFAESGDIIRDFMTILREIDYLAAVHLVEPDPAKEAAIIEALERLILQPHWDYFRDGGTEVLGIQRASYATVHLLIAREILGNAIDHDLDRRLMKAIADKGCLPCYRTVYDMEHPETVKGWDFDEKHAGFYDITMERWPTILGANNLRAAPTGALGIGALALQGIDDRADEWLRMAVASTERFLKLLSPDGSYFEGLSYLSYSLRTTLPFIQAHMNLVGDVDWFKMANWDGALEYILTMQFGKTEDGGPDIVNFSDARFSVFPGAISLIGTHTGNPLAGFTASYAGNPQWIYDLFWYRPDAPAVDPSPSLLNKLNDLDWIICRSGWEADDGVLAFKSGAPANHEHADRNHIMYKRHGERLLNDHVGAAYDRRHDGWKMRFTRGHNAVLIDGKGHPYIDGNEGTNDSKAYANILQWQDHGEHVWWTSDASAAYILDNYHVHQVLRTVLYAKPDVIVVVDQVRLRYRAQTVDARFFPDNGDGWAQLEVDGNRFTISRPNANLHGLVASDCGAAPRLARLEVEKETGDFPCIEVHADEGLDHHIVTLLAATPGGMDAPSAMEVVQNGNLWNILAGDLKATVEMTSREPVINIL